MALLIVDVERERAAAANRIRCVLSDRDSDSYRIARAHIDAVRDLRARLDKLRHEYYSGAELVAEYAALIEGYEENLGYLIKYRAKIKKYVKLVRDTNKLDKKQKLHVRKKINEAHLTNQRATDLRTFIRGYQQEIRRLRLLPKTFAEVEAGLIAGIAAEERRWDVYVENRRDADIILCEMHKKVDQLDRVLDDMRADDNVRKLQALAKEIDKLATELEGEEPAPGTNPKIYGKDEPVDEDVPNDTDLCPPV